MVIKSFRFFLKLFCFTFIFISSIIFSVVFMIFNVKNQDETIKVGASLGSLLNAGDVVLLNGDLGAGKTTFTQFVFACLGVTENVLSPTFAILKTYHGKFVLHHFDVYRITTEEAIEAGFDEILDEPQSIKFIEWSVNIAPLLPKKVKLVNIKYVDENTRIFDIDYEHINY